MDTPQVWVPVAALAQLQGAGPHRARAFGDDLVLWQAGDGRWAAALDRCPHRGSALSLGRVESGLLACRYHGWRFAEDGRCVLQPAQPDFTPPASHACTRWPCEARHGLLWLAPPGSAGSPPSVPGWPDRQLLCGPFDVATSAPRVVENFLDTAHFAFVHEGSLGDRGHAEVPAYEVLADELGRPGVPHYRAWQPRARADATGGAWVSYRYQLLTPFAAVLHKQAEGDAPREAYALWVQPLDEETSRAWFTIATDAASPADAELLAFQAAVFAEDRPVLESQRPRRLPLGPGAEAHSTADRLSAAYRRWLLAQPQRYGTC